MVLLTGLGVGMNARLALERRIRLLSSFERFIQRLSEQVRYTALPVADLLRTLADTREFSAFSLLQDTVKRISSDGEFRTVWQKTVKNRYREWALSEEEATLMIDFAEGLGTADVKGEIHHCERYAQLVRDCLDRRKEEVQMRGRLYTALGLCGGSAAALLLL